MSETVQIVSLILGSITTLFGMWIAYQQWKMKQTQEEHGQNIAAIKEQTSREQVPSSRGPLPYPNSNV